MSQVEGLFTPVPPEIFDAILHEIDQPSDVLSLALTCHSLSQFLIPNVLEFRSLSAPIWHATLWDHLARHPEHSRHLRVLRISEDDFRVPRSLAVPSPSRGCDLGDDSVAFRHIFQSLRWMRCLRTLQWDLSQSVPPPPEKELTPVSEGRVCGLLTDLQIIDLHVGPYHCTGWMAESKLFQFENITKFRFVTKSLTIPHNSPLEDFLLQSRHLETLELSFLTNHATFMGRSFDNFLSCARWPNLKDLSLTGATCSTTILSTFFRRHPSIHSLRVLECYSTPLPWAEIEPGMFPCLRVFEGGGDAICALAAAKAPLEQLVNLHVGADRARLGEALQSLSSTLRRIKLAPHRRGVRDKERDTASWIHGLVPNGTVELANGNCWTPYA
ncbi:hypothetical protein JAAARDRAFT_62730 [Jaapia argillacea MUCL 33604]|uniref:F-box domain-containing protein n=1 Tax=Jaapia argillacea MUCL 33604 TaxID=933084 RepID=A0A067PBE1_9AGAM|nr:hypothetical protein JAAARDRAFT_62730 [Jaapia argillacea MUCL 33604]